MNVCMQSQRPCRGTLWGLKEGSAHAATADPEACQANKYQMPYVEFCQCCRHGPKAGGLLSAAVVRRPWTCVLHTRRDSRVGGSLQGCTPV